MAGTSQKQQNNRERGGSYGARDGAGRSTEGQKVVKSALCLIPPPEMWGPIQAIRRIYDKSYVRWPPHVNLLYPFIPDTEFGAAVPKLQQALASVIPFTVTLANFDYFSHNRLSTLWLNPETQNEHEAALSPLHALQKILEQNFPHCNDLSTISNAGFSPHLSVGQFQTSKVQAAAANFLRGWNPLTFTATSICMISRKGFEDPFEVRYVIPFGEPCLDENLVRQHAQMLAARIPTSTGELGCRLGDFDDNERDDEHDEHDSEH